MLTGPALVQDAAEAACWRVDLSQVRALIDTVAAGGDWADWVAALLHGARIVDANTRSLDLVGAPSAREIILGQPVANFCPQESWNTVAALIVAVVTDPAHAARTQAVNSFMLRDSTLTVWGAPGAADTVWVQVDGELADDRSFWAVRASEQRYRRLIHHLPERTGRSPESGMQRAMNALSTALEPLRERSDSSASSGSSGSFRSRS